MSEDDKQCPKCEGRMAQGFVPDFSHGGAIAGRWNAGSPRKSFFGGLKGLWYSDGIPIAAFRCGRCGFMEFYANSGFEPR